MAVFMKTVFGGTAAWQSDDVRHSDNWIDVTLAVKRPFVISSWLTHARTHAAEEQEWQERDQSC